ncbi:MAG: hypothetical protein JWR10_4458 [Rubritepida sp.]|nr:hypothetical protein [Rubritepida sp.]
MSTSDRASLLAGVGSYYTAKLAEFGPTNRGVDWNGEASHNLRHQQFLRLLAPDPEASVIDLGCGYGDFLGFLRTHGHSGRFVGYDIAPAMIAEAVRLHGVEADRAWHVGAEPAEPADYAIASGILNVKGDMPDAEWSSYVIETIELLGRSSRRGFAVNMLSLSSDPERRRANLHYADPVEMLRFCLARYGRSIALLQDYGLYEFTLIVRHS